MDEKVLEVFAREAAKSIKTQSDLDNFRKILNKVTIKHQLFSTDEPTRKVIFLVIQDASKSGRCP
ncbi:hypothetical protein JKP22_10555 [Vibrio vulnificus]|uniref:hypothetical protein n=1 Tax=Vibrio vulnificus TaxID=672 RepID=UPI000A6A48A5|nr:hypothetical protein [Vibrio vulnificus]EGQ9935452.1 hypothetical protein [Vibrio vulnificus]EGR7942933.1 hypothetical protein [Vibrio vulnificus]EIV8493995.1 hypothetical protein [Vibrio vulnificus]ELV8667227.1 hypothetical protein [Vibrio vulnificus]MCA4013223.1 hypothetical protein [Vibrio vulnificus]